MMKRNIMLIIAYDGTRYKGFQRLGNEELTIQAKLEACLSKLLAESILVIGASRTDAGVHALEQVVNFHTENPMPVSEIQEALNRYLPEDIIVKSVFEVAATFHSRYWIQKKTYVYRIHTSPIPPLFERHYVYNLGQRLDLERMKKASQYLLGTHDFQAFTKRKTKKSTIRTIYSIDFVLEGSEVQIYLTANGFLYNMVRIIVGTLIEVGKGLRSPESICELLTNKVRSEAGYLVPSQGLTLYKNYFKREDEFFDQDFEESF